MKYNKVLMVASLVLYAGALWGKDLIKTYNVANRTKVTLTDAPVVLSIPETEAWVRSVTVLCDQKEIPCQTDDLDGDGKIDEVCFTLDLSPEQTRKVWLFFTNIAPAKERYPARVHAQMFLKDGKNLVAKKEVSTTEDNMYNKLHHHGPAFESELAAYRIYFDKKQTVDLYGKKNKGLELANTMWYPTDAQLAAGAGDDVLMVVGSVGAGALKGWDQAAGKAVHIEPVASRSARIVACGPVRTIVEMKAEGWRYQGRTVDLTTRYTLYAGHRDAEVEGVVRGGQGLVFCTGVMKIPGHTSWVQSEKGVAGVWGTAYPVNDTVKYGKQTVGLGVNVPAWRIKGTVEDDLNYLFLLTPDNRGVIRYRITFAAEKESFGYKNDREFYHYLNMWSFERPVDVKQTR